MISILFLDIRFGFAILSLFAISYLFTFSGMVIGDYADSDIGDGLMDETRMSAITANFSMDQSQLNESIAQELEAVTEDTHFNILESIRPMGAELDPDFVDNLTETLKNNN